MMKISGQDSSLWGGLFLLEFGCMSASDTVKDVVRIVTTGGHAKDVIDPLQTKLSLLTEQVAALEKENRNLKTENDNLRTQLQNTRPKSEELSQKTEDILKAFFNRADEFSLQDIARLFHMQQSVADYHLDVLRKLKFIKSHGIGFMGSTPTYIMTPAGREYVVKNLTSG
jgi:regulator of replication initiation timing